MRRPSVPRHPARACALLLGCAGVFVCPRAAGAQAGIPAGYQQGIFELHVPELPPQSISALVSDSTGALLLPLRPLLELTGAPYRVEPDSGVARVPRPRGAGTAVLDLRARTLTVLSPAPLAPGDAVAALGDIYVATPVLKRLLEAEVQVEMADLRVTVSRDPPFPSQERLAMGLERRRDLIAQGGREALGPVPFVPLTGGGVLEWGATSRYPGAVAPTSAYARLGLAAWGGMLSTGGTLVNEPGASPVFADLTASYRRVFPGSNRLTQVELGDVVTQGLRARSVRGVQVTNAPFARDPLFGQATLAPSLPSGWEYEIYQDGRLLGFSDAATRSPVTIPLQYGSTPVQVKLYGPAGERIQSDLVYLVPVLQLPAGRWQYAAAAGACPHRAECRGFAYGDLRHGVTPAVTLFGGTDVLRDSTSALDVRPYAGASLVPGRAWVVEAQAMLRSFAQVTAQSSALGRYSGGLSLRLTDASGAPQSVLGSGGFSILPVQGSAYHVDGALRIRTGTSSPLRALDLTGGVDGPLHGAAQHGRFSIISTLPRTLVEAGYEHNAGTGSLFLGRVTGALTHGVPKALNTPTLSVSAATDGKALQRWEWSATAQPAGSILTATARWQRGAGSPTVLLGATVRLRFARAQTRFFTQPGRASQGAVSLDGVAAFGRSAGVHALPYGGIGQAGMTGVVFRDENGNGVQDEGETAVKDASVNVGDLRVKTDGDGRYTTWSVLPYQALAVRLDTVSLPDPSYVPARREVVLRPTPHLYTRVDFPLVQTREMTGTLVPGRDVATTAGITVEIVSDATGDVQRTITFSDGEFYVGRVLPGRYQVRVAESSLRALHARSVPGTVRVDVAAGADAIVEVPRIVLERT
ncbi:MAG: uncharacterized protein JWM27_2441 [Gemmatimonadetes bacterium]|nr:uncharacterized protein [Gemmatimonadota bacterium]